MFFHLYI